MPRETLKIDQKGPMKKSSRFILDQEEAQNKKQTGVYEAYLKENQANLTKIIRDLLKEQPG